MMVLELPRLFALMSSPAAFSLSSGTIGAALSSSLSRTRSIAVSYGTVLHPTPTTFFEPAHQMASRIISHLWTNWGADEGGLKNGEVDLYSVNIPLVEKILSEEGLEICWTTMWRNSYGRLFQAVPSMDASSAGQATNAAGPDAPSSEITTAELSTSGQNQPKAFELRFRFAPEMKGLITPSESSLPVGSDGWAIHKGLVSVTPLRASFAEPPDNFTNVEDKIWKMKL